VPLSTSFRSCQPVIDTVNRVFGDLGGAGLPDGAVEDWERVWQTHRCQEEVVPSHGFAAVLEPPCEGGELKPADEHRYRVVAGLLKEIDPLSRGLSVAVLVRTNECGKDMVDFLRGECPSMNIVHEGRAAIKDNPVVSLLLSLVKFAAHPGDTTAWRHLQMSPLKACFEAERLDRDSLSPALLREIQACGFEALVRRWGHLLDRVHPLDDFGRKRLDDLVQAAGGFDANGGGDCNAFLRFVDNYEVNEIAADDAVRVMTIHQSKGLGFDMVILPDLQKGSLAKGGQADFVLAHHPGTGLPVWALKMPRRVVAENDAVLEGYVRAADETASFDALCALYVALTRARQGLYMVTCFPGKSSAAITPAAVLKSRLVGDPRPVEGKLVSVVGRDATCLYEEGESDWYLKTPQRQAAVQVTTPASLPEDFSSQPSGRLRLIRVSPSARHEGEQKASLLFESASRDRMDLGTAVHGLFETVSWIDETDVEAVIRGWLQSRPAADGVAQRAAQQFRQALSSEEVWQALSRPEASVELWRERHFEIVLEKQWVSGAFDRVHIIRGADGKPVTATVLDFKSDELRPDDLSRAAERYRSQMALYGEAVARMLHLDPSQVSLRLVFTHPGKVYDLR